MDNNPNPMRDYVEIFRANLPAGITYDPTIGRYFCNNRRFLNEWEVERYLNYIKKFGFTTTLLLDQFTGAAAAYSLRSLSKDTTNVVRVRRSSDNAELDFTPDEINDGSLLTWVGTGGTDNGFVTTWYDQSGNGNDATQSVAETQPMIVNTGVLVTEGGKPAFSFNGNQGLRSSSYGYAVFSMFSVRSIEDFYGAVIFDGSEATTDADKMSWFYSTGLSASLEGFGNPDLYVNNGLVSATTNGQLADAFDVGQHIESSVNGDLSTWTTFDIALFNNLSFIGTISEVILYPSDQSANRTDIESNIADYYGITLV